MPVYAQEAAIEDYESETRQVQEQNVSFFKITMWLCSLLDRSILINTHYMTALSQ